MNHMLTGENYDQHLKRMERALEIEEAKIISICPYCYGDKEDKEAYCKECTDYLTELRNEIRKNGRDANWLGDTL